MNEETCVSCGATIPEGRQVCLDCKAAAEFVNKVKLECQKQCIPNYAAFLKLVIGVTPDQMYDKLRNPHTFTPEERETICRCLGIEEML